VSELISNAMKRILLRRMAQAVKRGHAFRCQACCDAGFVWYLAGDQWQRAWCVCGAAGPKDRKTWGDLGLEHGDVFSYLARWKIELDPEGGRKLRRSRFRRWVERDLAGGATG